MVSLVERKRSEIAGYADLRLQKVAAVLDATDINAVVTDTVRTLNSYLYSPRNVILASSSGFVDITGLSVDEVCNVYYSDSTQANFMFSEIGILPFITNGSSLTTLESVVDYLSLQTTLNLMNRQMQLIDDWELCPVDSEGRQMLQIKNNGLFRLEFLPYLDPSASSWHLYEHEYQYILEMVNAALMLRNAEIVVSGTALGVGKEFDSILNYWTGKVDAIKQAFLDSAVITYLQ